VKIQYLLLLKNLRNKKLVVVEKSRKGRTPARRRGRKIRRKRGGQRKIFRDKSLV
jgi:hypothetical protein